MSDFGIFRGFSVKLFEGQTPIDLGLIGSYSVSDYLLDTYTGAAAAYSLRLLSYTYTGDAIRVRRASDNAESNIGFVNGQLDTTTLETFCSGTNGYVTTWYDQSGNGYDATQTTAAYQPQIVSSGSVITENGKPCVQFDGSNDYLPTDNVATYFSGEDLPITRIIAMTPNDDAGENFFTFSSSLSNYALKQLEIYGGQYTLLYRTASNVQKSSSFSPVLLQQQLIEEYNNGTIANVYLDSVNRINNFDIDLPSIILDRATIGALRRSSIINYFDGTIQEVILYPSDQSSNRSGIESNINSQYNIYWDGSQTSLLDTYGGSAAAYSLRALSSSYTGALIKVRRASDNAEQDIYAKYDGTLNTDALESFCASTDGYVTTWYDQSGNGYNATQSTSANQPQIVSSGSVILENGNPALNYDGTNHYLSASNVSSIDNQLEVSIISINKYTREVNVVYASNMNGYTNSNNVHQLFYRFDGDIYFFSRNQSGVAQSAVSSNNSLNNQYLQFGAINSTSSISLSVNGNNIIQTNLDIATPTTNNNIGVGGNGTATNLFEGTLQELILYPSDQSSNRTGIETNINSHYNIY